MSTTIVSIDALNAHLSDPNWAIIDCRFNLAAPEEGGPHTHDSTEIFYVLEGELIHIVGDQKYVVRKGEVGIVGSGDVVRHGLETDAPVRALVIWVPGGEVARLIRGGFTPVAE